MKFSDHDLLIKIWEKVSGIEFDMVGLKADVAELKTDVKGLKADMVEVRSELGFIKGVLVEAAGDLDNHELRIKKLEAAT